FRIRSVQWKPPGTTRTGNSTVLTSGPPGLKSDDTPASRQGSYWPLTNSSRVVSLMSHPPVHWLRASNVRPAASPYCSPSSGGKNRPHCRSQYCCVTSRDTIDGRSAGAPSCQYPNGSLHVIQTHCRSNVLLSVQSL